MKINWRKKRQIRSLIDSLYEDEERGDNEIMKHLPKPQLLSVYLKKAIKHALTDANLKFLELKESWSSVAGADLSRNCQPLSMQDTIMTIEAKDSLWLREIRGRQKELLRNIASHCGRDFCTELRIIPAGRESRN